MINDDVLRRALGQFDPDVWTVTAETLGRLTENLMTRIHMEKVRHLSRGADPDALMLLWPLSWVAAGHRDQFRVPAATLMGLPMTLSMLDEPVVVAR